MPTGRERWLEAGQELLRRGGIGAVKLQALTELLGLTTGSFYHHFDNMAGYLDALARHYGSDQPRAGIATIAEDDPRRRLERLSELALADAMLPLDAAMRDWAGSNPVAAQAVRDADEILLRFIEQAFLDLGHDRRGARTRATLLLSAGVARISPPWPLGTRRADAFDAVLDVLSPASAPTAAPAADGQTRSVGRSSKPRAKRPASSAVRSQSKIT
jgi:AcrR family transcriptional regulator